MFFNSARKTDIAKAQQRATEFARDNLLSMSGAPDAVGVTIGISEDAVNALTPDSIKDYISELKDALLKTLVQEATGLDLDTMKDYLTDPASYFDYVLSTGRGQNVTLADFDTDYLRLEEGQTYFDPENIPATYNTITMSKLIMLDQSELNRLIRDLGGNETATTENVMLFPMESIDEGNQWCHDMALEKTYDVYKQIFKKQTGENPNCAAD